jgi:hypothetical protein
MWLKLFFVLFSSTLSQIDKNTRKNRPIAKKKFIFFLESTFKNKLKSKFSEFLALSLILNSNLKLQRKLFKRVKTFENKRKEAF